MKNNFPLALVLFFSPVLQAQVCSDVIALARASSGTVLDERTIESHASNFCNNFELYKKRKGNSSFGVAYEALALTMDSKSSSVDQIASKYCSASNHSLRSDHSYKNYVNSIADGAFDAYKSCLKFASNDVTFDFNRKTVKAEEFSVRVTYRSSGGKNSSAKFGFDIPKTINCSWKNTKEESVTITDVGTKTLKCNRKNRNEKDWVGIVRDDGIQAMTVTWMRFNKDGDPVDTIEDLKTSFNAKIDTVKSELKSLEDRLSEQGVQTGSVDIPRKGRCRNDVRHNVRVDFAKAFSKPPTVMLSLRKIKAKHTGSSASINAFNHLEIYASNIDLKGFTANWQRGCWGGDVTSSAASWVAIAL